MKNKIIKIMLGCTLICSIGLNVYLYHSLATTRGQVAVFSNQVVVADNQINNLNNQLSDYEDLQNQLTQLEEQLADSEEQVSTLEKSILESKAQIESLEAVIAESQVTIAELEKQQQNIEKPAVTQPVQQQPVNTIPGPVFGENMTAGTGTDPAPGTAGTMHLE